MEPVESQDITTQVADYIAQASYEDLPDAVILMAKQIVLDTLGITLGASKYKAGKLASEFVESMGGKPESTIIGYHSKNTAVNAAFANGVMAHDFDMDDSHAESLTHPAAVIVPAALAAGEREKCSGKELILGIVVGYDVECRLSIALDPQRQYARNFHPTCVCGCFGAAAAAGKILKLVEKQLIHLLGLSGCQASGLLAWETETGHMSKSFQTGIAARNGLVGAYLAGRGYNGPPAIFDGQYNIFEAFSSGEYRFKDLTSELGTRFEIMKTSLKLYSSCRHTHAPLDAFFDIVKKNALGFDDIREVIVKVAPGALPVIHENKLLTHNMQYVIAVAAVNDSVTPDQMLKKSTDPRILEFAERVQVLAEPNFAERFPARKSGIVKVVTSDGRVFEEQVDDAKGDFRNPISQQQVEDKFLTLAGQVIPKAQAKKLMKMVSQLETLEDIGSLMRLCRIGKKIRKK